MTRTSRKSVMVEGPGVWELLQPPSDALEVGQEDDSIACIPDVKRMLRVLVVDDNQDAADSLCMLLNLWKHDSRGAYDGPSALEMASARQPDVLLLDLSMPQMDGCQVAKQLRRQARFKSTLLIAITGWTDRAHHRLCDEAGMDHYLFKPIDLSSLKTILLRERDRLAALAEEAPGPSSRTMRTEAKKTECRTADLQGVAVRSPRTSVTKSEVLPC
jgi:CheY-like chemotaxis protein